MVREQTHTVVVNAHGALIRLDVKVRARQILLLQNPEASEERSCRVLHGDTTAGGKSGSQTGGSPAGDKILARGVSAACGARDYERHILVAATVTLVLSSEARNLLLKHPKKSGFLGLEPPSE